MIKIPDDLLYVLEENGQLVEFHENEMVYSQDDSGNTIYIIKKGRVRAYNLMQDGREINYEVLEKGRIFGDSAFVKDSTRPVNIQAITNSSIIEMPLPALEKCLLQNSRLCFLFLEMMSERSNWLTEMVKSLTVFDAYQKVAFFLVRNASENNALQGITDHTLPYSHQEIADSTFLQRPTVSKVLRQFERDGYIQTRYKKIKLMDADGLKKKYKV